MPDSIKEYPPLPEFDARDDDKTVSRACREWANNHPAATCQTDKDILSYIAFLQCLDHGGMGGAYVRLNKIAEKVNKTRRAVIYRINRFVDLGVIRKEHQSYNDGNVANQPSILSIPQGGSEIVSPGGVKNDAESCTGGVKSLHGGSEILEGEFHRGSEIVSPRGVKSCTPYARARGRSEYSDSSIGDSNKSESIKANGNKAVRTKKNNRSDPHEKPAFVKPKARPGESQQAYDARCQREREKFDRQMKYY